MFPISMVRIKINRFFQIQELQWPPLQNKRLKCDLYDLVLGAKTAELEIFEQERIINLKVRSHVWILAIQAEVRLSFLWAPRFRVALFR